MGANWGIHEAPLIGQFFDNPNETQKLQSMQQAAEVYHAMRPELQQAQLNALRQQMSLMGPVQNALGQMYGPGAQFSLDQAMQNPISDRMTRMGAPVPWDEGGGAKKGAMIGSAFGFGDPLAMMVGSRVGGAIGQSRDNKKAAAARGSVKKRQGSGTEKVGE